MQYSGRIIRPPSQADSILLQVTIGCSHNKCTFCGAYREKRFAIKSLEQIFQDIAFARTHCRKQRQVFFVDGDAMIMPQEKILAVIREIRKQLPWVTRIGTYAGAKSITRKTDQELSVLQQQGLKTVFMGLESGDDSILKAVNKWGRSTDMIQAANRLKDSGIKLNVTVLLGLGGKTHSEKHALHTGRVLSAMDPEQAAALTLMLIPGTPLHEEMRNNRFELPDARGMLRELRTMLAHTRLSKGLFLADHASNYLPMKIRMPKGRDEALARIDRALRGREPLVPDPLRRL
ncbi:MAG: radical SAM protein [Desulfovibrionales bacterium]